MWGHLPNYANYLRTFGEIGIVLDQRNKNMKVKLRDRGKACMFVGYADNHSGETYRMYNLSTGLILTTRDIRWLDVIYADYVEKRNWHNGQRMIHDLDWYTSKVIVKVIWKLVMTRQKVRVMHMMM